MTVIEYIEFIIISILQLLKNMAYHLDNFFGGKNNRAAYITAIATALGIYTALFRSYLASLFIKPEIDIKASTKGGYAVTKRHKDKKQAIYLRLEICNIGNYQAETVEAYISEVSINNEKIDDFQPMNLNWSNSHKSGYGGAFLPIISPRTSKFVDLGYAVLGEPYPYFALQTIERDDSHILIHGARYQFTLIIAASNLRNPINVNISMYIPINLDEDNFRDQIDIYKT